jgi:hypothetical protein
VTYIDDVAANIRARVPVDLLPDGDTTLLFQVYAVLLLAKGADVSAADVHNAWTVWMQTLQPNHESLVRYEDLDRRLQASDQPFAEAIREAYRRQTCHLGQ